MHDTNFMTVKDGKLYHSASGKIIEHPAIVLDVSSGTLLKVGEVDWVREYFESACPRLRAFNKEMADSLAILEFKYSNSNMSVDELCTMINYFNNSIGPELLKRFFLLTEDEMHRTLRGLMEAGL